VLAVPSWERKVRVFAIWLTAALFGRDILSLASVQHPRDAFVRGGEPVAPQREMSGTTEAVPDTSTPVRRRPMARL
jgi:NADH dehydrogenase